MRAELIMVGTELLLGEIVDTNATFLARKLADLGIDVFYKSTVGDNLERVSRVLLEALGRSDIVIMSGGLGPTDDDLTREIVSEVTKRELVVDEGVLKEIEDWFAERYGHSAMPAHNRKQALFPSGSQIIPNPVGTAPGFCLDNDGKMVIALPGVSRELKAMFTASVAPILAKRSSGQVLVTRNLHFAGIGESSLEEILADLLSEQANPTLALYASGGTVRVRMAVKADTETA
ncbi:MAG TPA: competence/damage-inducible protein A, partial [Firmicutes bacterium]|nr:competence/damage-inducible protein A [Bacillota bacterium]